MVSKYWQFLFCMNFCAYLIHFNLLYFILYIVFIYSFYITLTTLKKKVHYCLCMQNNVKSTTFLNVFLFIVHNYLILIYCILYYILAVILLTFLSCCYFKTVIVFCLHMQNNVKTSTLLIFILFNLPCISFEFIIQYFILILY